MRRRAAQFPDETIVPGGFAERARAVAWVDVPDSLDDARATAVEPLACVLRGAERVPCGRVLVTHRVGLDGVAALLADPPRDYLKAAVVP